MTYEQVEQLRLKTKRFKWLAITAVIVLYLPLAYMIQQKYNLPTRVIRYAALPLFLAVYKAYTNRKRDFILLYNEALTKSLVNKLRPDWIYEADQGIEQDQILSTYLIEKKPFMYTSNLMTGLLNQVNFRFCHVETTKTNNLAGRLPKVVFKGYFFEIDFPKYNRTEIHVHPPVMKDFGNLLKIPKRISTDAKEFDKLFKTYSDDAIEMRYVLTLSLMSRMIDLQNVLPGNVSFLFTQGKVYIAIKIKDSTLEPKVGVKIDMNTIEKLHEKTFDLVELFIKELKLQLELWDNGGQK